MSTSLTQKNNAEYYFAIAQINFDLLVRHANNAQAGMGDEFKYLRPSYTIASNLEKRKAKTVQMYLNIALAGGTALIQVPKDACQLEANPCGNSGWNQYFDDIEGSP